MALKKSELYSSIWSSCDELRGGMDASQYKDYVLVLLFIKYVSDKYAGMPYAPITIPAGASFKDMVALKGKSDIGDQINKKIIEPLAKANKLSDMPDFNEASKLGSGKEMVDRLTNLIAIFENKALDFSKNRADGDDILGDAYEYLMRHFATESGKSKGQFYTPAEVSRVIAQIIGIREAATTSATTVYDPTCGSGSLLLKVGDEAGTTVTLYGQEKDAATSTLARMNMILHNNPIALIEQGNTLSVPKFKEGDTLKTFDYVVANPPFSDKRWRTGINPAKDEFERFKPFGIPPAKQGDYAYLLHIVRSLKSTGKRACMFLLEPRRIQVPKQLLAAADQAPEHGILRRDELDHQQARGEIGGQVQNRAQRDALAHQHVVDHGQHEDGVEPATRPLEKGGPLAVVPTHHRRRPGQVHHQRQDVQFVRAGPSPDAAGRRRVVIDGHHRGAAARRQEAEVAGIAAHIQHALGAVFLQKPGGEALLGLEPIGGVIVPALHVPGPRRAAARWERRHRACAPGLATGVRGRSARARGSGSSFFRYTEASSGWRRAASHTGIVTSGRRDGFSRSRGPSQRYSSSGSRPSRRDSAGTGPGQPEAPVGHQRQHEVRP